MGDRRVILREMNKDKYFGLSPRIARWKIDNPLENWLGRKADTSEFWKRLYIFYYQLFDNKYYKVGVGMIRNAITLHKQDFVGCNEKFLIRDMLYCLHRFGYSFRDYCVYGFVNKTLRCRLTFVSDKLRYHYCDILNDQKVLHLMTDKYACYQCYKEFFKRDVSGCYSEADFGLFSDFVDKHDSWIFKPLEEHSGHGIRICSAKDINKNQFFTEMIQKGAFVIEEVIQQGNETAIIHPQSVNTLRVVTFVIGDEVNIIGVTWRIGVGNSVVDNAGSGGIYASVDYENGIVQTSAIDFKGNRFNVHPDTKVQIVGYKLPKWDEALLLIRQMATKVKGTTLIAWDIAYSQKGWVMVEANDNGAWRIVQSNGLEGKKGELYSYMDKYYNAVLL